ncbi:TPA_asm: DUF1642 domain-containing protein [Listeria monocytogenes]|uniref:DUF1642 domain-containing protein n=1 Tax=Listeria monocytogenes TaxID=1639 RepID=UPI0004360CAD|nr:DUF1642 domain-containing protein [Listeria monocytogenes]EAA0103370.1 DUF1642 domain-containing protein [Listeria monocytogenes]EAC4160344.1 DUF1642 domain-containing protein [Listeria monocytogenes]EAC6042608.1 DUF1642 domain-containing protein [Listeria monocytogenes]EAC6053801.1 DUF1642 domain-containing protein [Listeria monocytogenes]EAC7743373.1 DUF1642 domain-containing protein [Listeria monocytogenes]
MNFKVGDKAEFIYRNKKSVGEINGVYPGTQEVSIKQSDSPIDLLFSDKAVVKVEEQERIVVPQFVADWISRHKQEGYNLIWSISYENNDMPDEIYEWLTSAADNQELFARAWLDGYEVEKEPLYYVRFINNCSGYLNVRNDGRRSLSDSVQNDIFKTQFTEAEIKEMDERYWQFVVPVRDLEGEDNE